MTHPARMDFLQMLGHYLVRRDAPEAQTKGGVVVPEKSQSYPFTGVIVKNPGQWMLPVGTRVIFSQFAGFEVRVEGESLKALLPSEIVGYFGEEAQKRGGEGEAT